MKKDDSETLKALFAKAAEIAKGMPENLQEAAFNRALEALQAGTEGRPKVPLGAGGPHGRKEKPSPGSSAGGTGMAVADDPVRILLDTLNRTEFPWINASRQHKHNALFLLAAAATVPGCEFLSPGQIVRVLKDKFRVSINEPAVRMTLGPARQLVDRQKVGQGYKYRLMAAGEDYLEEVKAGGSGAQRAATDGVKRKSKKASTSKAAHGKISKGPAEATAGRPRKANPAGGRSKGGGARPGPLEVVTRLLDSGYFASGRTVGEVLEHIEHERGFRFKNSDIAVSLLRLVRGDRVGRHRNKAGQYEYKAK